MQTRTGSIFLVLILLLGGVVRAQAQFLQTSSTGVYQSPDGRAKVLLGNHEGAQGIFVVYLAEPVSVQEFDVEKLSQRGATHVFIKFDAGAEFPYSQIVIGEKSYKVSGNLNLQLGTVRLNIDNTNPYLTVTYPVEGDSGAEALIGFYGLAEVMKGAGNLAAIATANLHSTEIAKVLKPYIVRENALWLGDKKVETPTVGLFVRRDEHTCLKSSTAIVTAEQQRKVQNLKSKGEVAQGEALTAILAENQRKNQILGKLVLRSDPAAPVILLDMSKNVYDLRPVSTVSRRDVCVLSPIN
jgi:hypothetical protein